MRPTTTSSATDASFDRMAARGAAVCTKCGPRNRHRYAPFPAVGRRGGECGRRSVVAKRASLVEEVVFAAREEEWRPEFRERE